MKKRTIKRYELLSEIGRGGMAVVYQARDSALDRPVAVKVLHPHLASRPESRQRFLREARAVAKIRHPNVVEIYDFSSEDDAEDRFIVTELIDGQTLREFVEDVGVAVPEVGVAITLQLVDALKYAHELGIIHRDIKPENVMVGRDGKVKLMDFGIAHVLDAERMTASGSLLGSPAHMPPEIVDGKPADFRSDIFSLGTVLYYVATNALPFSGNSATAVLRNIIDGRYAVPSQVCPKIGRGVEGIIRRCLSSSPDERFQTVDALRETLVEELATVGIEDYADLASEYLASPEKCSARLEQELVEHLLTFAEKAVSNGDAVAASDAINRVLAYDPDHDRAIALLARMRRGRRVKFLTIAAAASLLFVGGGVWAVRAANLEAGQSEVTVSASETAPVRELEPTELEREQARLREVAKAQRELKKAMREAKRQLRAQASRAEALTRAYTASQWAALGCDQSAACGAAIAALEPKKKPVIPRVRPFIRPQPEVLVAHGSPHGTQGDGNTDQVPDGGPTDPVPQVKSGKLIFEVYPLDTAASAAGKTFKANDGNLVLELPAGTHEITFSHADCVSSTVSQHVGADATIAVPEFQQLDWRPGSFTVRSQRPDQFAYYYGKKDDQLVTVLMVGDKIRVSDFGNIGEDVALLIYEVPRSAPLTGLSRRQIKDAATLVKELEVGPGAHETVFF